MDADVQMLEIARLNDEFRRVLPRERVIVHRQIQHWSRMCEVLDGIRVIPGGADEPMRDTGDVHVDGHRVVWKIHYYDKFGRFRCSPLDPDCLRVLTAMAVDGADFASAKGIWDFVAEQHQREAIWQGKASSMTMRQRLRQQMTSFVALDGELR